MTDQIDYLKTALQNKRSERARAIRMQSTQLMNMPARTLADVDAALLAMKERSHGTCAACGLNHHKYRRVAVAHWDDAA